MIAWLDLIPFLALGLLGSLHCAGMCGGFALAVAGTDRAVSLAPAIGRQSLYLIGKATAYAVIGLLLATGSHWLGSVTDGARSEGFASFQRVVGWAAGLTMVVMGLVTVGIEVPLPARIRRAPSRLLHLARPLFAGVRALPGSASAFGTGVVNGMMPCGLSWAAFLLATQCSPLTATVGAFAFGLATAPVLLAVGLAPRFVSASVRQRIRPALGLALVLFGGLMIYRAGDGEGIGHAACCAEAAARL